MSSGLLLPKAGFISDRNHLAYVALQPCCVPQCRNFIGVHVHHLKRGGRKVGDAAVTPLCPRHHLACFPESVHAAGDMDAWWAAHGVDPVALATQLWAESHADSPMP